MSTWCSKHVETRNKLIVKEILFIKFVNYYDKKRNYTFVHSIGMLDRLLEVFTHIELYNADVPRPNYGCM